MATWSVHQRTIAAYGPPRPPPRQNHDEHGHRLIAPRRAHRAGGTGSMGPHSAPPPRRHPGLLRHHTSNGPTEAINGRLESLRRNALGFRNLTHYRLRSLLHSGALHQLVNAL